MTNCKPPAQPLDLCTMSRGNQYGKRKRHGDALQNIWYGTRQRRALRNGKSTTPRGECVFIKEIKFYKGGIEILEENLKGSDDDIK